MLHRDEAPALLPGLLTLFYGICFVCSSYRPVLGVFLFGCISLIASLPRIIMAISIKLIISLIIAAVFIIFPLLWPIGILLLIYNGLAILSLILSRFFLLLAAAATYMSLGAAPFVKQYLSQMRLDSYDMVWVLVAFLIGALVLQVIFVLMRALGHSTERTAAFIFGLVGFYVLLIFSYFMIFKGLYGSAEHLIGDYDV